MYAPAIETIKTSWTELEIGAGLPDLAKELVIDEFDLWNLSDAGMFKGSYPGGCQSCMSPPGDDVWVR
ncbi:hypothetical protein [Allorhizocola rhizosphaerae]|uniref:hypothetical protein n=1 Tax=Allorhizocola rhizosphaerae TaxID=1872709 RepID=UPI000E3C4AE8|nr:hypothetical protein [Allorhizocola rhizosphaerae]